VTKKELLALLAPFGVSCASDRKLSLSHDVIRCPSLGLVAVGGDAPEGIQSNALLDALVWHREVRGGQGPLRLRLGRSDRIVGVLEEVGGLLAAFNGATEIQVEVDDHPVVPEAPRFAGYTPSWLSALLARADEDPPPLVRALSDRVIAPSFRWYRPLSTCAWSGRVEGLRICEISPRDTRATLQVGAPGKAGAESPARARFRQILRNTLGSNDSELVFDANNIDDAVAVIAALALDRADGALARCEPEHRLEARVLRGATTVTVDGTRLVPVEMRYPFQFPTLWSLHREDTRYVDALMRTGDVPWVVELKVPHSGGQRQYYRHAIKQAVLYRQFVRGATEVHPWFASRGLDARCCEAALIVAFRGRNAKRDLLELTDLARHFGVHLAVTDDRDAVPPISQQWFTSVCAACRQRKVTSALDVAVCGSCLAVLHVEDQFREQVRSNGVDPRGARAWLVDAWGRWHPAVDDMPIGRANDALGLVLTESTVSGFHAELCLDRDSWEVIDLGSTNGTEVNARPIARSPLHHGDHVAFGSVKLLFIEGPGPSASPTADVPGSTRPKKHAFAPTITLHRSGEPEGGGVLRSGDIELILPSLEFAFLSVLIDHAGQHVAVYELASLPWNNAQFTPNQLHQMVHRLRNRLAQVGLQDTIESARGVGYRFVRSGMP